LTKHRYVLCIAKTTDDRYVFVKKTKPNWQAGKFNFPGGKIEPGEDSDVACNREFLEETGINVFDWEFKGSIGRRDDFNIDVYYKTHDAVKYCHTTTDEEVHFFTFEEILASPDLFIDNIVWLLALIRYHDIDVFEVYFK
jgi:8-oxo-dGTP pyrophosphatase MutT (NUDIX family)